MPRRIGTKYRIASVTWEWTVLVTGCGHALNAFGAANLRFPRSDILCGPKDFPLAPRYDLALFVYILPCHIGSRGDGYLAMLDRTDKLGGTVLEHFASLGQPSARQR
jgi:hypothetical protein